MVRQINLKLYPDREKKLQQVMDELDENTKSGAIEESLSSTINLKRIGEKYREEIREKAKEFNQMQDIFKIKVRTSLEPK